MEILDNPVVEIALVVVGVALLIRWLISIIPEKHQGASRAARRLQLDGLINKLSREERDDIKKYMAENRKILAIKYFRATTNAGLRDAREAVEKMMAEE